MCGIVGFTSSEPLQKKEQKLKKMLGSIMHRGPDGEGMEVNDFCAIGMRRLAIIDPKSGWQPIYNKDKSVAIVFNGEIYNYKEVWADLIKKGYHFVTDHSDTETILHGYEEWGEKVVEHLVGMFAFAIYDLRNQEVFIARDRLGIKPLYYCTDANTVYFASELKAIFQIPEVKRVPNWGVLYQFLMFRVHDSTEETFFHGVKRLLPGHWMILNKKGIKKIHKYWNPTCSTTFASSQTDADYAHEFYELFQKVMKRHLISDVPVGVSLSGGLDSSGVSSVMHELMESGTNLHTNGDLHTFSAIYPNQSIDESDYMHEVENAIHSKPHYTHPTVDKFWNEIMEWVYYQEEPTISSAPYAYYSVYREAHKHVKVMLSGNGGDELLAGYIPYFKAYLTSAIDNKAYLSGARELICGWDLYQKYFWEKIESSNPFQKSLAMKELLDGSFQKNPYVFLQSRNLNERLLLDVTRYSTPNLLRYEDKNSMAFSIESRVPFLDHELVEYIFNLPIDQKLRNGWNRFVYRNAMKGHMPEKNRLRRNKIGFTNPEVTWIKAKAPAIRKIFQSKEFANRNLYNTHEVTKAFDEWCHGRPGDGLIFWRILITELWFQRYIDPITISQ
ncbi:asparagine synthase (glutamine-hydrolyzing) [Candidatus Roizmanbacteria bacterium]|nr:asparagine synthase (glutamine-hydrolyzing) [Candidatus Roizmanbacteria bacterium]